MLCLVQFPLVLHFYTTSNLLLHLQHMEAQQYAVNLGTDAKRQTTKPLEIAHLCVCGPIRNMYGGDGGQSVLLHKRFFEEDAGEIQRRVV